MFETTVRNHGQRSCISRSSVKRASSSPTQAETAEPTPNQPGSISRHWLQLNTQGMARRSSMRPELVRDAGREPMFIVDSSTTGVICLNQSEKPGVSYTSRRYAACEVVASSSAMRTNRGST